MEWLGNGRKGEVSGTQIVATVIIQLKVSAVIHLAHKDCLLICSCVIKYYTSAQKYKITVYLQCNKRHSIL